MKHLIIVNPKSGRRKGIKYGLVIQKLLAKYNIYADIFVSKYSGHIFKYVSNLVKTYDYRIYCVGGDGTLNELISAIVNTSSEVVIIPSGTGNDFRKSISKYVSIRKIIKGSITTKSQKIDTIKISKSKYCINILNMGFDAHIAKNVEKFKNIPFITGKSKYNLAIFYTMLPNKKYKFKIHSACNILKGKFTLVAIGNGKYYGGGICPCPLADTSDGKLNVCAVDSTSLLQKITLLPKYKKGTHTKLKQAHIFETDEISVVSSKKFPICIDGEVYYTNKVKAKIIPKSLNVVFV